MSIFWVIQTFHAEHSTGADKYIDNSSYNNYLIVKKKGRNYSQIVIQKESPDGEVADLQKKKKL